jgi:hypothetical protein
VIGAETEGEFLEGAAGDDTLLDEEAPAAPTVPATCTYSPAGWSLPCAAPAALGMVLPCGHVRPICDHHAQTLGARAVRGLCGRCLTPAITTDATWSTL